jgi:hypothetical protein
LPTPRPCFASSLTNCAAIGSTCSSVSPLFDVGLVQPPEFRP